MSNKLIKKMKDYKKCIRLLDCANYIYLDEIENFEFKKISKYTKSRYIYSKIKEDFELVNRLITNQDLFNAAAVLRTTYESIIYIIATSYNTTIKITLNTSPKDLRKVLDDNCSLIFTSFFTSGYFKDMYDYLCKIIHPTSLKELASRMAKTIKYKESLLINLKYIMLVIEYMYLTFLNKKVHNDDSKIDLNLIDLSTYVNFVNISKYIGDTKDITSLKKYCYFDHNKQYILKTGESINDLQEVLKPKKSKTIIKKDINRICKELDFQINDSKYKEIIPMIINGNYKIV